MSPRIFHGGKMKIAHVLSLAAVLGTVACAKLDVKNMTSLMKSFDSKDINYHDMMISYMKTNKVKANSIVDTYMASFQHDEYEKFKDDELKYDEKIKSSTEKLQNTIDGFEMKPYKIQYNFTFGKYDTAKECFVMGESTLNDEGYVSNGSYYGLQFDPLIIDSPKSSVKLAPVLKLKPKDKSQFACIKVPKNLANQITSLGGETSRNTEVRFDFEVVSVTLKKMSYTRKKAPTKLQYIHKVDPGTEDVTVQGYEALINVKAVKVMKPGYSDQLLNFYNLP
jgi:Domain of unknown function (DUF4852)